uniref:ZCF37 n=1 Tax=Oryza meridionalis TaxID=40149 RepID=A0A0E0EDQ7_9ORYZ
MLFCGTGSFKDVDGGGGKAAAPEAKKKKQGGGGGGKKENPYASRGLDKFSTVLSELESRREKILRQVGGGAPGEGGGGGGGGEHVLVRFVQSEGKGWVPIVVKLPPEEEQQQRKGGKNKRKQQAAATSATSSRSSTPPTSEPASPREDVIKPARPAAAAAVAAPGSAKRKAGVRWSWSDVRPRHYMPFVAVLLLASLVVFGKVFAICCTSVWWYLVPILTTSSNGASGGAGEAHGVRRSTAVAAKAAVKVLGKKASDKKMAVAPLLAPSHGKRGSSGVHELMSPRSHPHGKKG